MKILYTSEQVGAATLPVEPVTMGTDCTLEIHNYSPYFLSVATTAADAGTHTGPTVVMVVEPWTGRRKPLPITTANSTLWIGGTTLSPNSQGFGGVTNVPPVFYDTYPAAYPPHEWTLIGQGVTPVGGQSLDANITNSDISVVFPAAQAVNANITNSTLSVVFPNAQAVDANITNSTINVTFPSAQEVVFPNAQDINLSASSITLGTNNTRIGGYITDISSGSSITDYNTAFYTANVSGVGAWTWCFDNGTNEATTIYSQFVWASGTVLSQVVFNPSTSPSSWSVAAGQNFCVSNLQLGAPIVGIGVTWPTAPTTGSYEYEIYEYAT